MPFFFFFFFNDTATTEIYTLSLHDALPISAPGVGFFTTGSASTSRLIASNSWESRLALDGTPRSEEHTSELQSHLNLVCRLLLEKKKSMQLRLGRPPYTSREHDIHHLTDAH